MTDEQFRNLCNVYGFAPSRSLRELLETATAQAVISERKACADICDQHASIEGIAQRCAAAIRARGQA